MRGASMSGSATKVYGGSELSIYYLFVELISAALCCSGGPVRSSIGGGGTGLCRGRIGGVRSSSPGGDSTGCELGPLWLLWCLSPGATGSVCGCS